MTKKPSDKVPCERCGELIPSQGIGYSAHMRKHERESAFEALRREVEELRAEQQRVKDDRAEKELAREAAIEAAKREEQLAAANMERKAARLQAMYDQEEKVPYTAGDDGFDMTVNHYRVTIPPNTIGKIPKSWLPILQQRLEVRKRNAVFADAVKPNAKGEMKTYEEMMALLERGAVFIGGR